MYYNTGVGWGIDLNSTELKLILDSLQYQMNSCRVPATYAKKGELSILRDKITQLFAGDLKYQLLSNIKCFDSDKNTIGIYQPAIHGYTEEDVLNKLYLTSEELNQFAYTSLVRPKKYWIKDQQKEGSVYTKQQLICLKLIKELQSKVNWRILKIAVDFLLKQDEGKLNSSSNATLVVYKGRAFWQDSHNKCLVDRLSMMNHQELCYKFVIPIEENEAIAK